MKPFSALAALEDHLIDPERTEKCEGYVTFDAASSAAATSTAR